MKLSVYKDGQKIQDFEFGPEQISVKLGRDKSSTLVLDHKRVSRTHAEIISDKGIYKIHKRSAYDALYLNGDSIESAELRSGDQISLPPFAVTVFFSQSAPIAQPSSDISAETMTTAAPDMNLSLSENSPDIAPVEDEATKDFSPNLEEEFSFSEEKPVASPAEPDPLSFSEGSDFSSNEENQSFSDDSSLQENSEFPLEESGGDKTSVLTGFANYQLEIYGEFAPFDSYTLEEGETFIGRDPAKAKIVLKDPEVSSLHAKIFKKKALCTIEDLQSGNGTLLNGKRINKSSLENGDEILIGSTTFTVKVLSSLLENEKERLMPVEANQEIEIEEIVEVLNDDSVSAGEGFGEFGKAAPEEKSILKNPEKRKKLIYGIVIVLLGYLLFSEDEDPKKKNVKKDEKKNFLIETEATPGVSKDPNKKELTAEDYEYLEPRYLNAKNLFDNGRYDEALRELENIFRRTDQYKNARQLEELSKQGLAKLEEIERKKREEIEDRKRKIKVQELLKKASDAVDKKEVLLAENLFGQISKLDPENSEVESLRSSLENWKRDEEAKKIAEAAKLAERERKTKQFQDAKAFYNRGEWYNSVNKLENFMRIKGMDEDFLREAQQLLNESKAKLKDLVDPLVGKARSLKESQDLKGVYQAYVEVLKFDPSNEEALNEIAKIRDELINRAKTIYREAIIAESMSLFDEAKDKFKEVMQISPEDSDYHRKAKDKLKQYLE